MPGLQLMDTTIRDGQQSLWATRMQLGDMLPILPKMDKVIGTLAYIDKIAGASAETPQEDGTYLVGSNYYYRVRVTAADYIDYEEEVNEFLDYDGG